MASIHSASAISESAFGCEHLAALMLNEKAAGQFKGDFMKTHNLLTRSPKPVESLLLQSMDLLRPKYVCLTCSEPCVNGDRKTHTEKTGHQFYMESRSRSLYCQACDDLVYDYGLERFRSPTLKYQVSKNRPHSEVAADEIYVRNNANKRPCTRQGARGLYNLGQTCYMNVILQAMLHDPLLSTYFLGNGHQTYDCTVPDCVGCAVAETFYDFNNTEKVEGFAALNLLLASWKASPALAGYRQQDAHEYYQFLVDRLHATADDHLDDNDQNCPCFFHKAFYGKLRSSVTCHQCGNVTLTEDPMVDLSLDVQAKKRVMGGSSATATATLSGCLESFTSPERLMAGVYNCSGCDGTQQKATKQLRIKKLPSILCMQLKRFDHNSSVSEKVEGRIDFPLSINMLPYTTKQCSKSIDRSKFIYDLSSAVVHKGKLDAGHYYAYCRHGDEWMRFDDDKVTPASESEVLSCDAYLLFYSLRRLPSNAQP
ncbi:hypothetical protein MAP00_001119 [Monascus purpureus]|nr:hypothetical protein MAP00_001119 [Monascus purpureus]